jgi:hypothetical protein
MMRRVVLVTILIVTFAGCEPNPATVPAPVPGGMDWAFYPEYGYKPFISDGVGAFRTDCRLTKVAKDDPLGNRVPGGAMHWHDAAGSDAFSATMTDPTTGGSTCFGRGINKTSYWVSSMFNIATYNGATGQFDRIEQINGPYDFAMQAYYKSGYDGVASEDVEWFPEGLRMIAGDVMSTSPQPGGASGIIAWDCINGSQADSYYLSISYRSSIPTDCPPGKNVQLRVKFPQCVAVDVAGLPILDSPNHKDHMAYPLGWPDLGCPSTHPFEVPEIIVHWRWPVPPQGAQYMRLGSDMYDWAIPAGYSAHSDWWNGWAPTVGEMLEQWCYNRGADCRNNLVSPVYPEDLEGPWWALAA